MSLLARYLSQTETNYTIPSTDNEIYKNFIFSQDVYDSEMTCATTLFQNILPVPRNDVSIERIVDFRNNHRGELLNFRKRVQIFQEKISLANETNEIKNITTSFAEDCERGVNDIIEVLNENNIHFGLDSLQTLINNKTFLSAIGSFGVFIGGKLFGIEIPVETVPVLPAITGTIEIGNHYLKSRLKKSSLLRESAFAYLYQTKSIT